MMPFFTSQKSKPIYILLFLALALISCGSNDEDPTQAVADAEPIVAPTATAEPTATALPTEAPADEGNQSGGGSSLLGGLISGGEEEQDTAVAEATAETPPTSTPIPQFEPVEVSINLQRGELNPWIELIPPPGWSISQGVDGYLVSRDPAAVPNSSFLLLRRWGNVVNIGDWNAYLPDGQEEPNSTVRIGVGGFEWEGVFITNEDNSYRAFFAVNNDSLPSYTILMIVPSPGGEALTREEMVAVWDRDALDLNTILRRLIFS